MYIDRILYPVTTLGPGKRIAVWTAGCERHCPGCANPELWEIKESQKISEDLLANLIKQMLLKHKVDGITITGGEPFLQSSALASCLNKIGPERPEVLIFSGFQMDELRCDPEKRTLLLLTDVLVDGAYIRELNDGKTPLRGSSNQAIHYLNKTVIKNYEEYLERGRQIENFVYGNEILSVGIHRENGGLIHAK